MTTNKSELGAESWVGEVSGPFGAGGGGGDFTPEQLAAFERGIQRGMHGPTYAFDESSPTTDAASHKDFFVGVLWGVFLGALLWVPILWLLWPKR